MQISTEGKIGVALAFLGLLGGGAVVMFPEQKWIGVIMVAIALIGLIWVAWLHFWRDRKKPTSQEDHLEYLGSTDVELSSAIRAMAHKSAWGRWYAAQHLVMSKVPITERYLLDIAASVVHPKILDGEIRVRGRLPNKLAYEDIERTFWRSSAFWFLPHPMSLWRLEIVPVGGVSIEPDGKMKASHKPSEKRNAAIRKYDSLLVDAHEFETMWPKNEIAEDKARKSFLKKAKRMGLDKQTIKSLS